MDQSRREFLRALLTTPSPSGYEAAAARRWREEAGAFADEVTWDVLGNSVARVARDGAPKVVIEGHIDEIGFIITYIDEDGYLWFDKIGGWDDQVIVGQRVRIAGANGPVVGVIGKKAAHLLKPADRERPTEYRDLWIDIGARDRAAATERIAVGDAAVLDVPPVELSDDLWASRSLDNRVGAFVALEAARLLAEDRSGWDVYALAATQEEITLAGAAVASFRLEPSLAIVIDVTHATDYPGADKKADNEVKLGGGPVITRGASTNPVVAAGLIATAGSLGIEAPVQAAARHSGTDADAIFRTGAGIATGIVSIPNRYMHSPSEVVSLTDLDQAARLIAAYIRDLKPDTDLRP